MSYANFLMGAGASTAFGFPSMKQLTTGFAQYLRDQDKRRLNELYQRIVNIMNKVFEDQADVESIMSVILGLKEDTRFKENIGDFGLYVLYGKDRSGDMFSNLTEFDKNDLDLLETEYKEFIRSQMELSKSRIDNAYLIYDNLFGNMWNYCASKDPSEKAEPYSHVDIQYRKNVDKRFTIFTTNYDTIIEKFFQDKLKNCEFYTGAREEIGKDHYLDMDYFVRLCFDTHEQNTMRIIKLHGSVNWIKDKDGNLIQKGLGESYKTIENSNESGYIKDEIMIYPLSQKQLYLSPFIQFFSYLEKELRSNKIWIVIGYSFRDIFIRNMFEKSIDTVKKIILVTPHSNEVKRLFNSKTQDKIIEIQKRFGNKEDYEKINEEIRIKLMLSASQG